MEFRARSKRSDEWAAKYQGAQVTPEMINLKLEGPARVLKPNGKPLCVFLPGAASDVATQTYPEFTRIRVVTDNRAHASGAPMKIDGKQKRAGQVMSSILGSFDETPRRPYCRLTAFTAQQVERWDALLPYFERIARLFEENVPERYAAQMREVERTSPDWVIRGTPFTTITVNNTYPTGIHTDKGDLDAGFSTLGCIRRGDYEGGWITFPQYGVAADLKDGDVLLMDAHEWHGNTPLHCGRCGETLRKPNHVCDDQAWDGSDVTVAPERISIVSYFRTDMVTCGSLDEENARRAAHTAARVDKALGLDT